MKLLLLPRLASTLLTLIAAAALPLAQGADTPRPILCIGDSLTFGFGGHGTTWPAVLTQKTGTPTVNQGFSAWTPRHLLYYVLLHDVPTLSVEDLRRIPPAEYEDRRHQPAINHLRTFLKDGQHVRVADRPGAAGVEYLWRAGDTRDTADTIKPVAVGDPAHRPLLATGRWVRVSGSSVREPSAKPQYSGVIIWAGANGMDADEADNSIQAMLAALGHPDHFLVLGLINRADPSQDPQSVSAWAQWIGECNARLSARFPGHFLDLQAWATATGPYAAGKSAPAGQSTAEDAAARRVGVLPESLRAPENRTHLNARGYALIGALVADWIRDHGW